MFLKFRKSLVPSLSEFQKRTTRACRLGTEGGQARDLLGRVYEYFIGGFAGSEGKRGGEFYTPRSVVPVLLEQLSRVRGAL